jgi:hypothetical protein
VAFCLLPNHRTATYVELFKRLKEEATANTKTFEPKCVISDFESAFVSAVRLAVCLSFVFALKFGLHSFDFLLFSFRMLHILVAIFILFKLSTGI